MGNNLLPGHCLPAGYSIIKSRPERNKLCLSNITESQNKDPECLWEYENIQHTMMQNLQCLA